MSGEKSLFRNSDSDYLFRMRILIVDDQEDIRLALRVSLELEGWSVYEAESGLQALSNFGEPDFVVLDQSMPGLTGIETATKLREQGFEGSIVLFSAYLNPKLTLLADELGLSPVSKVDFGAVLRHIRAAALEKGEVPSRFSSPEGTVQIPDGTRTRLKSLLRRGRRIL